MKNILVTGGSGFIGTNFIQHILENEKEVETVVNLDLRMPAEEQEPNRGIRRSKRYHFVCGDIRDERLLSGVFEEYDIDTVVNLAETTCATCDSASPNPFFSGNVAGTRVLLDAAREYWQGYTMEAGFQPKRKDVRFLQVSPLEIYLLQTKLKWAGMRGPQSPYMDYISSKENAERVVLIYHRKHGIPVSILRCPSVYGPYQSLENVIPQIILGSLNEGSEGHSGYSMRGVRDWLYVKDCCTALTAVLKTQNMRKVYNVDGQCAAYQEIAHLIRKELGMPDVEQGNSGSDTLYWRYARANIKDKLEWSPEYTLREGISETVQWYMKSLQRVGSVLKG